MLSVDIQFVCQIVSRSADNRRFDVAGEPSGWVTAINSNMSLGTDTLVASACGIGGDGSIEAVFVRIFVLYPDGSLRCHRAKACGYGKGR